MNDFWKATAFGGGPATSALYANRGSGVGKSIWDSLFGKDPETNKLDVFNEGQKQYQNQTLQSLIQSNPQIFKFLQQFIGDDEESLNQYSAPFLRQFQTKILPSIRESFGGGESGASSGLYNALAEAGTDLQERLASGRQNQGLKALDAYQGMSHNAMQPSFGYQTTEATNGLINNILMAFAGSVGR